MCVEVILYSVLYWWLGWFAFGVVEHVDNVFVCVYGFDGFVG